MSQRLYISPDSPPIEPPSGAANGLGHYPALRRQVDEASEAPLLIYEDFRSSFSCVSMIATAATSFSTSSWQSYAEYAGSGNTVIDSVADVPAGRLSITTAANAADKCTLLWATDVIESDKAWAMECSVAVAAIDKASFMFGAAAAIDETSLDYTVPANVVDTISFSRIAGEAFKTQSNVGGTDDLNTSTVTPVNSTFNTLGIEYNGQGTAKMFIDDVLVDTFTVCPTANMRPVLSLANSDGTANNMLVNHIAFRVER